MQTLETRFAYAFQGRPGYPPTITAEALPDRLSIGNIDLAVTDQPHGNIYSAGLRFSANGKVVGYATDFHEMTTAMRDLYRGLDLWVVDALRYAPHPAHPTVTAVLGWVEELQPQRTVFIHMDQSMDYATLCRSLPSGVEPGFDGMVIDL
jgi:phosphoribosyl 1,2-cyclic phosphate phosphodiesterase